MHRRNHMGNSWNNTKINIELLKATTAQVIKWDSVGLLHSDPVTVSREHARGGDGRGYAKLHSR